MTIFSTNIVTRFGFEVLAKASAANRVIFTRALALKNAFPRDTFDMASDEETYKASSEWHEGEVDACSATQSTVRVIVGFDPVEGEQAMLAHTILLYGMVEGGSEVPIIALSDPTNTFRIFGTADRELAQRVTLQISFAFEGGSESVQIIYAPAPYLTVSDGERFVSCHKAGDSQTGEDQNVYGRKTFHNGILVGGEGTGFVVDTESDFEWAVTMNDEVHLAGSATHLYGNVIIRNGDVEIGSTEQPLNSLVSNAVRTNSVVPIAGDVSVINSVSPSNRSFLTASYSPSLDGGTQKIEIAARRTLSTSGTASIVMTSSPNWREIVVRSGVVRFIEGDVFVTNKLTVNQKLVVSQDINATNIISSGMVSSSVLETGTISNEDGEITLKSDILPHQDGFGSLGGEEKMLSRLCAKEVVFDNIRRSQNKPVVGFAYIEFEHSTLTVSPGFTITVTSESIGSTRRNGTLSDGSGQLVLECMATYAKWENGEFSSFILMPLPIGKYLVCSILQGNGLCLVLGIG